jgi:hypothetical protein
MSEQSRSITQKTCFELRAALESLGWQQVWLAQLCGVKDVQVWRWCEGKAPIPTYVWTILSMAEGFDAMDIVLGQIMEWDVEHHHVYRNRRSFKELAKRFHPDTSRRDTTAEMQIINKHRPPRS